MNTHDVLDIFREAGALLEGHFILSSGRRSSVFLQKALIFKNPVLTSKLCKALAEKVQATLDVQPDIIVAPAMGGVIPGYETARHMGLESLFVEREGGEFCLRRGFTLKPGQKVHSYLSHSFGQHPTKQRTYSHAGTEAYPDAAPI